MKHIIKCNECGSNDLTKIDIVFGKDTKGERYEDGFKCNNCGGEMTLSEIDFELEESGQ